ncbi:hypothetical protein N7491_007476 [Penicillium cf. griseofulvum]|nr:hypothetical protein N7491_007476 [Penicillium cf. griseofulvum]
MLLSHAFPLVYTARPPAATVAAHMLSTFHSIRIGLLVGIGGGIPSREHDIRLGDVVVSRPEGTLGAVVQFDRGKTTAGHFARTGSLNKPPLVLLNALADLEAEHELEDSKVSLYVTKMLDNYPKMRAGYSYQGQENDILFESDYHHQGDDDLACVSHDASHIVQRTERDSQEPLIHYGIIASSNQVVKDGILRDRIGNELGAICLEMEAAGLMDNFPCIVIRGICDYADSHKNKRWQRYAAGCAAAYAKELLYKVPATELAAGSLVTELLQEEIQEMHQDIKTIKQKIYLDALPLADGATFNSHSNELNPVCHPETRVDLLAAVSEWSRDPNGKSIFWLNGKAGTGKSTISRTVACSLQRDERLAASFFFKRGEGACGTASRFFTTIAAQIAINIPSAGERILKAIEEVPFITDKRLGDQFLAIILQPLRSSNPSPSTPPRIIVVDALDECDDVNHIRTIIRLFSSPSMEEVKLRVFLSSRPETAIRLGFNQLSGGIYRGLILHEVPQETIKHDIQVVLVHELSKITRDYNMLAQSSDSRLPWDWPGGSNIDQLVHIACPLFISASTLCRFIGDFRFNPKHRLATLLQYQSASHASKMQMTYLPVLDQIITGDLTKKERDFLTSCFRTIVGSIIILANPLSTSHLAGLLTITKREVDITLEPLHAVLNIPNNNDSPVRLFHLSFGNFLLDEELLEKSPFYIDGPQAHQLLLDRCLDRMSRDIDPIGLHKNICGLDLPRKLNEVIQKEVIHKHLPGDLEYACLYWVSHLEQSKKRIKDGDRVHCFLESHFLHWLEALALLKQISGIINSIETLAALVDKTPEECQLSMFLHDARKFVLANRGALEEAPLLMYPSLVFTPHSSIIHNRFADHIPDWFSQLPTNVFNSWDESVVEVFLDGHINDRSEVLLFSPDDTKVAADRQVWDTASGRMQNLLGEEEVKGLSFSSSENLAYVDWNGHMITLDLVTREETKVPLNIDYISAAVFSQDASKLAVSAIPSRIISPWLAGYRESDETRDEEESEWETIQGSDESSIEQKDDEETDDYSSESDDYPSELHAEKRDEYSSKQEEEEEECDEWSDEDSDEDSGEDSNRQEDDRSGGASDAGYHSTADEGSHFAQNPGIDAVDPLLSLSADGSTVAWCYKVSDLRVIMIQVFHIEKRALTMAIVLEWPPYEVWKIMLSPDGHKLAIALGIGMEKREVHIRNTVTGEQEHAFDVSYQGSGMVCCLAFSSDSTTIILESFLKDPLCTGAAISRDGLKVAISSELRGSVEICHTTALYTAGTEPQSPRSRFFDDIGSDGCLSPDGSMLITMSESKDEIVLWDVSSGQVTDRSETCFSPELIIFSPNSTAVAVPSIIWTETLSCQRWIEVWRIKSGKLHFSFKRGPLATLPPRSNDHPQEWPPWAFNAGGTRVVLAPRVKANKNKTQSKAAPNETVIIEEWDTATGEIVHTHALDQPFRVIRVACSPDGSFIHFSGRNIVTKKQEIRYFQTWGHQLDSESRTRLIEEAQAGWRPYPQNDESILSRHLRKNPGLGVHSRSSLSYFLQRNPDTEIHLTPDRKWITFNGVYIIYIPGEYRPSAGGGHFVFDTVARGNSRVIAMQNQDGRPVTMVIDAKRLSSCLP